MCRLCLESSCCVPSIREATRKLHLQNLQGKANLPKGQLSPPRTFLHFTSFKNYARGYWHSALRTFTPFYSIFTSTDETFE
jgi:hypothetical protein